MDLKLFYQKLRKIEQEIADPHVIVVSHETPDGGRAGQRVEVPRGIAARLLLEGKARLANAEESAEFRAMAEAVRHEAEQRAAAERVQVNVITEADLRALKSVARPEKR
ncbi:MAG TPA: hypothetical protein VEV17_14780 [Bryobacteraceae bacterium]|nr:hypothetical protein [Bryobacteraceae bacterium]